MSKDTFSAESFNKDFVGHGCLENFVEIADFGVRTGRGFVWSVSLNVGKKQSPLPGTARGIEDAF